MVSRLNTVSPSLGGASRSSVKGISVSLTYRRSGICAPDQPPMAGENRATRGVPKGLLCRISLSPPKE